MPYSLMYGDQYFGEPYSLHLQGTRSDPGRETSREVIYQRERWSRAAVVQRETRPSEEAVM